LHETALAISPLYVVQLYTIM